MILPSAPILVLALIFQIGSGLPAASEDAQSPGSAAPTFEGLEPLTPLQECLISGNDELAFSILEEATEPPEGLQSKYDKGQSLLHFPARRGNPEVCLQLVRLGADVNAQDREGNTPLMLAAKWGHPRVVAVLALRGAKLNVQNHRKQTALHLAVAGSSTEASRALIRLGAFQHLPDEEGKVPQDLAETEDLRQVFARIGKVRRRLTTADLEVLVQAARENLKLFRSNREKLEQILNDRQSDVLRKEIAILEELDYCGIRLEDLKLPEGWGKEDGKTP